MTTITTITSRSKSGKALQVALIPVALMRSHDPERRNYEASALAVSVGCGPRAWRLVDDTGAVVQWPSRSYTEAAAISGPANERHDW